MKCIECGHETEGRLQDRELRLDLPYHVVVADSPVLVCPNCGAEYPGMSAPAATFASLARWIAQRPGRLQASEVRFLRNALAWSQGELGRRLGVAPETISRWENGKKPVGYQSELALRFLVIAGTKVADQLDSTEGPPARVELGSDSKVKVAS